MAKDWLINSGVPAGTSDEVEPNTGVRRHLGFATLAWAFLLSRLFFIEVASVAYIYLPHAWVESPPGQLPPSGNMLYHIFEGLWVHWDGLWYLSISTLGYHNRPTASAFFPLYPMAMKLFGGGVVAGMTVSLASFLVGLWFFSRLVSIDLGPRVAWFSVLALAFFPTAFYFNAVYSEGLFFMLAAGSLYFLRRQRYWIAGPLGALATLTSTYGALLVFPFLWIIWRYEGFHLKKFTHVLWMPLGIVAYMVYLVPQFGDPLIFEAVQSTWGRHPQFFGLTLYQAVVAAYRALPLMTPHSLFATGTPSLNPSNVFNLLFAIFAIIIAILSVRRIPLYLWLYMAAALLIPLSYPAAGTPLMSMPRLLIEAFPVFIGIGSIMARIRWTRAVYFIVALPVGMILTALFATAHWVA